MRLALAGQRSCSSLGEGPRGTGEHRDRNLRLAAYSFQELPITLEIAARAPEVTVPHADPGERMIVATAQLHGIPLMTSDHLISACRDIEIRGLRGQRAARGQALA